MMLSQLRATITTPPPGGGVVNLAVPTYSNTTPSAMTACIRHCD